MDIVFKCETNKNYVAVNTLELMLPKGIRLTIDREQTEYDIEGTTLNMTWRNCYLWSLNDFNIFGEEGCQINDEYAVEQFKELTKNAIPFFVTEDDTETDYICLIRELEACE